MQALGEGEQLIPKSRWDSSIEGYLATDKYNDQEVPYNEDAYEKFIGAGMNICLLATQMFVSVHMGTYHKHSNLLTSAYHYSKSA